MGWNENPEIASRIDTLKDLPQSGADSPASGYWNRFFGGLASPGAGSRSGIFDPVIAESGEAARDARLSEPGIPASAGEQPIASRVATDRRVGNVYANALGGIGGATAKAVGEGGQFQAKEAGETNAFNLDKYKTLFNAINRGSTMAPSLLSQILPAIIGGAAKVGSAYGAASQDDSGGGPTGSYSDSPMPNDYTVPGTDTYGTPEMQWGTGLG